MDLKNIKNAFNKVLLESSFFKRIDFLDNLLDDSENVAIDIGAGSVKIVEIEKIVNSIVLKTAAYKEIPTLLTSDSRVSQTEENLISQTLNDLLSQQKIKGKKVRLIISDPGIYLRHIDIPQVAEEELSKAIKWQAEKYTPFPIDDAIVDFQLTGLESTEEQNQINIIIVAVKREIIDKYLTILKMFKLAPSIIDIAPFASAKSIMKNYSFAEDEIVPVIDIGLKMSSISIITKDSLLLVRTFNTAGNSFTKALSDGLKLDIRDAEKKKREVAIDDHAYDIRTAVDPVINELVMQIERSFAYIERSHLTGNIQKLFLCGGGSRLKGLDKYLESKLQLNVELVNPFNNVKISEKKFKKEELNEIAVHCTAAFGELL